MMRFLYKFRPVQDYFSSYETGKSVTGGKGRTLRKRTCTPTSRTWFVSPVIVRLINWAARLRRRVHCLGVGSCQSDEGCFNPFYHMLCDVASIFVVRTLIVSQAYTMVLTLIDNTRIHIFIYMYSISRRHFTCPFTDLLYVNKRTAIHDSNIYKCNRGTFCPRAHRQNKDHIKPDQLSNHIAAWQAERS